MTSQKIALVTGGNRGIGLAIVAGLAKEKDIKVLLASRDIEQGTEAAKKLIESGLNVIPVQFDLDNRNEINSNLANLIKEHGQIDILINNAGILEQGNALTVSDAAFDHSMEINMRMPLHLIRQLMPGMIEREFGRIVNVSSGWGSFAEGLKGPAAYSTSKAALNALTLSLSRELPANVKINSMCPGWVRTRMGGDKATRTPEQGASTAIWLATLPQDGPNGGFFRDKKLIAW